MAVALPPEGFDGGLVFEQGHHNIPVPSQGLLVNHHHVPGEDARLQHGLPPNLQREVLPGQTAGVEGEVFLDIFLGQNGRARRHIAHQGHLVAFGAVEVRDRDGSGFALRLGDEPGFTQALQVKVDCGGGLQVDCRGNLPHRGGIAVLLGKNEDKIIDLLLLWGEFSHKASSFLLLGPPGRNP